VAQEPKESAASPARKWIADEFDGCVWIHDVDGDSVQLLPGDEIPAGHEEKVGPHIPTTTEEPKSARMKAIDPAYVAPRQSATAVSGFDPGQATVKAVVEYVRDNPEEAQAVLDRERAGKNRRSIFSELEA
jgi:hypothetical protein